MSLKQFKASCPLNLLKLLQPVLSAYSYENFDFALFFDWGYRAYYPRHTYAQNPTKRSGVTFRHQKGVFART